MSGNAGRGRLWVVLGLLVVAAASAGALWWWPRPKEGEGKTPADPAAALAANNRGVGHMEWFNQEGGFSKAIDAFEEALRHDPDWLPAHINLAIALLNTDPPKHLDRATQIFEEVLKRDPDNLHAHYCLGMIALYQNRRAEAYNRFDTVVKHDPRDAHAWFHKGLTHPAGQFSAESKECFEKALALNPNLTAARYQVAQHPHQRDPARTARLLAEHKELMEKAEWFEPAAIKYTEMGKYAEVIGRTDRTE